MLETSIQWTCDGCGLTDVWHEMDVTKGHVRLELKEGGWKNYGLLDYCPDCVRIGNAKNRVTDMNSGEYVE